VGGERVGPVHDGRIRLAQADLRQDLPDVQLARGDARLDGAAEAVAVARRRGLEDAQRVRPDRHLGRAHDDPLRARKLAQGVDRRGIAGGNDDDRLVAREAPWRLRQARLRERTQVPLVGRCEQVGAGAVLDLRAQLLRSGEVERDCHAGMLRLESPGQLEERLPQRGGREHRQLGGGEERAEEGHPPTCRVRATDCQAGFTEAR
jgi:hypothetical protein